MRGGTAGAPVMQPISAPRLQTIGISTEGAGMIPGPWLSPPGGNAGPMMQMPIVSPRSGPPSGSAGPMMAFQPTGSAGPMMPLPLSASAGPQFSPTQRGMAPGQGQHAVYNQQRSFLFSPRPAGPEVANAKIVHTAQAPARGRVAQPVNSAKIAPNSGRATGTSKPQQVVSSSQSRLAHCTIDCRSYACISR